MNIAALLLFVLSLTASAAHGQPETSGGTKPNVLLISIDTLRADHLGSYGYSTKTPAIDELASRSVLFRQAISQVPLTLPSHATILTGLYPDQHGIRNNENFALPSGITTLAEVFQRNGYATGAVVGSFSLDGGFGLSRGFQSYEDAIGKSDDPSVNRHAERRAETVWKLGRQWLESRKGPWFCFLHFFDPHTAYNPPAPHPQSYDGEIAYVDHTVGQIMDFLRQTQADSTTIVVLLSDHGESLGEHGEASHGVFLYDATLRVPLLIAAPGLKPGTVNGQVRLVDIAPTVLHLAEGCPGDFRPSGQNLAPLMRGESQDLPAYSESFYTNLLMGWAPLLSIRSAGKKWIHAPKPELYDLLKDPRELKNMYAPSSLPPSFPRELAKHQRSGAGVSPAETNVDPEVKEKLASLGYITGGSAAMMDEKASFDPKDGIAVWGKIEAAVTAAQTGKMEPSKQLFAEVLKLKPDNVIALKFLANVLRKEGKNEEAVPHLQKALQSNLHRNETRYDLGQIYYEQQKYSEALELLSLVAKEEPSDLRALKLAGLASMKARQYENAAEYLAKFLEQRPEDTEALSYYARLLSHLKQDQQALKTYAKLESLRPLTEEEAVQVAAVHLTRRDTASAEKYFRMGLQVNPESKLAWRGLGYLYASKRQFVDALDAFLRGDDCNAARNIVFQDRSLALEKVEAFRKQCQ